MQVSQKMKLNFVQQVLFPVIVLAYLSACSETQLVIHSAKKIVGPSDEIPETSAPMKYKVGNPYQIFGVWYYPSEDFEYNKTGIASWYGPKFHGRKTANGEIYDMNALTAAHRTLPMPSYVRVSNLENGRSLVLRINDRGPFARVKQGRIIDISRRGAQLLGFQKQGTARVQVQVLSDRSRQIKARITNELEINRLGTPIKIDRMPKPHVEAQKLPVIGEKHSIKQPKKLVVSQHETPNKTLNADLPVEPSGEVSQGLAHKTHIYVQVGSFTKFDNASRVRAKILPIVNARISQILINGRDFYRVRVGPISTVSVADQKLDILGKAGFKNARIIVD